MTYISEGFCRGVGEGPARAPGAFAGKLGGSDLLRRSVRIVLVILACYTFRLSQLHHART
ncbi:hypothetical protein WJ63_08685 [Burkholderia pyrrocinia]|nr:hypothetical protein WJ63_08685 [Burkholderia pyrrocinia]